MESYLEFLERKRHVSQNFGIPVSYMPDALFPQQKYVAEYGIVKGRCAEFLDTGHGKTIIELVTAVNYIRHTNKPALILTPLAVAFQFIKEAEKFHVDDIEYSKDGKFKRKIVVTNYERLQHFDPNDFDCVILDESSILKNFEGEIKTQVTAFLRKVKYRFLFTATPSPNDFTELGTSSEALGYLGYTDMLTKFFTNNEDTISPQNIGTEWILKGHAKKAFFEWVSSWSISMRKPSDLGFSDDGFELPKLIINDHVIQNRKPLSGELFNRIARTRSEISQEERATLNERCEMAVKLCTPYETSVLWCNYNPEADLLCKLGGFTQIKGSMHIDKKEEILLAFANGEIKKLVTKPKITAFGLNWQHCNHTVYFPDFSYEKWYQAIRRFWRYGQKNEVIADRVSSNGQVRVLQSIEAKTKKANELFDSLNANLNAKYQSTSKVFNQPIKTPSWL